MAISGGIKFFKKSKNLYADGATITASSGDASAPYSIDRNPFTYWRSVASDDTTTETITLTFPESVTIDRLLLIDINWKGFVVKYFSGGSYVHFASVTGIDGSKSNITETAFADDTAYYEFTPVTTTSIQITITTTQTADEQKYCNQIVFTEELGTLEGYPQVKGMTHSRNEREKEMLSGKSLVLKSEESFEVTLDFNSYPNSLSDDIVLAFALYDREENFIIWLCGGRRGAYFGYQLKGWRLKDIYTCQVVGGIKPTFSNNQYKNTVNFAIKVREAVD